MHYSGSISRHSSRFTDPWCDMTDDFADDRRASRRRSSYKAKLGRKPALECCEEDDEDRDSEPLIGETLEAGDSGSSTILRENTWFTSMIQILMNTIGSTVVALPIFISKLGWVLSPTLLALAAVLSFGSGWIWSEIIDIYAAKGEIIIKVGDLAAAAYGKNHWLKKNLKHISGT